MRRKETLPSEDLPIDALLRSIEPPAPVRDRSHQLQLKNAIIYSNSRKVSARGGTFKRFISTPFHSSNYSPLAVGAIAVLVVAAVLVSFRTVSDKTPQTFTDNKKQHDSLLQLLKDKVSPQSDSNTSAGSEDKKNKQQSDDSKQPTKQSDNDDSRTNSGSRNTDTSTNNDDNDSSESNSGGSSGSSGSNSGSNSSGSNSGSNNSDDLEVRIFGTLKSSSGKYTVTYNNVTYTIVTSQNVNSMVNKYVRVEGTLNGLTITAKEVKLD